MKCRMCSRPLTRVGRLCRECEHELARMEQEPALFEGLHGGIAGSPAADALPQPQRRSARSVVLVAFCVGVLGAAGWHFLQPDESRAATRSVMLDAVAATAPHAVGEARRAPTPR